MAYALPLELQDLLTAAFPGRSVRLLRELQRWCWSFRTSRRGPEDDLCALCERRPGDGLALVDATAPVREGPEVHLCPRCLDLGRSLLGDVRSGQALPAGDAVLADVVRAVKAVDLERGATLVEDLEQLRAGAGSAAVVEAAECSICCTAARRCVAGNGFRICETCIAGACTRCPDLANHWEEDVAKRLGLSPGAAEPIARNLAEAHRAVFRASVGQNWDRYEWENELDFERLRSSDESGADEMRRHVDELQAREEREVRVLRALTEAARQLSRVRKLDRYDAKKAVLEAFRALYGGKALDVFFAPEEPADFVGPADPPAIPLPDPRWASWNDYGAPQEVIAAADGALPDGALVPMMRCLAIGWDHYNGPMCPDSVLVREQVLRYGERCGPVILALLANPIGPDGKPAPGLRWWLLRIAGKVPLEPAVRTAIFESALRNGRNDWFKEHLPAGPERSALAARYTQSPYGPPEP